MNRNTRHWRRGEVKGQIRSIGEVKKMGQKKKT